MSRKAQHPQTRHHVWVFDEDWQWLQTYASHRDGLTAGLMIRQLLHKFVLQQRERQNQASEAPKQGTTP